MSTMLSSPSPRLWNCEEFHRFGDLGLFEGRRAMLIGGVILEAGPMDPPHATTLGLVEEAVRTAFGAGWWLRHQSPLVLDLDLDPRPDLAVVPGGPRDYPGHPTTAQLVVEVSDESFDFDTFEKAPLYAVAGVPEYWIVNVYERRLLVHRDPRGGEYADYVQQLDFGPGEVVSPQAAPSALISVADLFV